MVVVFWLSNEAKLRPKTTVLRFEAKEGQLLTKILQMEGYLWFQTVNHTRLAKPKQYPEQPDPVLIRWVNCYFVSKAYFQEAWIAWQRTLFPIQLSG